MFGPKSRWAGEFVIRPGSYFFSLSVNNKTVRLHHNFAPFFLNFGVFFFFLFLFIPPPFSIPIGIRGEKR